MDPTKVADLKAFVAACKKDPALLADPSLAFFRDYLASLGAELPQAASASASKPAGPKVSSMDDIDEEDVDGDDEEYDEPMRDPTPEPDELDEEIVESDIELDADGVVEPDHDNTPQKMGDPSVEVTEDSRDASQEAKGLAMEAMSEGKLEEAVEHLTKAILLNPTSAIMYGTRASVFIKMKKPAAAIRDANAALEINPDSAKGYKTRGMANAMLGKWEAAARDLHAASNIDYDDEISSVLKKVEPNAHKIVEHRRKYDRLRKEREEKKAERDRLRRRAEAQAAYERAKKKEQSSHSSGGFPGGMPGGFPGFGGGMPGGMGGMPGGMGGFPGGMGGFPGGMGGMPGGMGGGMPAGMGGGMPAGMGGAMPRGMGRGMPGAGGAPGSVGMDDILNDPDLMAAFSDPEVMAALQDVMSNPANISKHQANPKVGPIIAKMMAKMNAGSRH
ncbi:hypothetical protein ACQ4PT_069753 [Festuca glaucescens]